MCKAWQSKFWRATGRIAGVALLVAIVMLLEAASSSATLHKKICPNAGKPTDQCAVVAFASGALAGPLIEAIVVVVLVLVATSVRWHNEVFPATPLFRLAPARPPPQRLLFPG